MIYIYIVPLLIIFLFIYARIKKVDSYKSFINGSKKSFDLVYNIFPYILSIMVCVVLLRVSGITDIILKLVTPIFKLIGIPPEICELVLLRPFTGSGSLALLEDILAKYGTDTYIGRSACVVMGSSETLFFVTSLYLSQTKVKKLKYTIPICLVISLLGSIIACLLCRII